MKHRELTINGIPKFMQGQDWTRIDPTEHDHPATPSMSSDDALKRGLWSKDAELVRVACPGGSPVQFTVPVGQRWNAGDGFMLGAALVGALVIMAPKERRKRR